MLSKLINAAAVLLLLYIAAGVFQDYNRKKEGDEIVAIEPEKPAVLQQVVNVYSSRDEEFIKSLLDTFSEDAGVKVNLTTGTISNLIAKMKENSNEEAADLFLTSDVVNIQKVKNAGLLQAVSSSTLQNNIPSSLHDGEGYWYGLSKDAEAIFYVKDTTAINKIKNYEDLATPEWHGKIINAYANKYLLAYMIELIGSDAARNWLRGIIANKAAFGGKGEFSQFYALVNSKDGILIAPSSSYGRLQSSEKQADIDTANKIGIFFPNQEKNGAYVNISAAGVTASAKNKDNAVKLLEFLSDYDARRIYAESGYEIPVNNEIDSSYVIKSWGYFKTDDANVKLFPKHLSEAGKMSEEEGWR